jgi:ubiquinone/menaquinone biosynthesis C-methylase UbiE
MVTLDRDPQSSTGKAFEFDYEDVKTVEGRGELRTDTRDVAALRLERCLRAIEGQSGKLLEIGCGAGRYTRAFRRYRPDLEIYGCDISQVALEEAGAADPARSIEYTLGDALNLPYEDGSFDIVVLFDVFEHVTDVGRAADEVARVLKRGGVFHCFVPCEGNKRTLFSLLRNSTVLPIHRWKREHIGHIQILTTRQMRNLLGQRGLRVQSTTFSFHFIGQIYDITDYWHREMMSRSLAAWQRLTVNLVRKVISFPTWRLAYYEDTWRRNDPAAIGVHITCRKS